MDLKKVEGSNIFITGGTGPFGLSFLKYLNSKNLSFNIFLLSRKLDNSLLFKNKFNNLKIRVIKGSLPFEENDFLKKLPEVDYILHMASVSAKESFNKIDPLEKYLLLNKGTLDICNYGKAQNIKRLLFTSSGCVYGPNSSCDPIKEKNILKVNGISSITDSLSVGKISAEYICNYFREFKNLETKIARCFSFCGEGIPTDLHYAIGNFAAQAIKNKDIVIKGDGMAVRSYMDLDDLAIWLSRALFFESDSNIYNFGSSEEISIFKLAQRIKIIANSKSEIIVLGKSNVTLSNPLRDYYVPDISKAKNDMKLSLQFNLDSTISKYIKYLREE